MKVSIIIPVLNEENYLPLLLDDISIQSHKPFEVIVIDGNSEDKTIENALSYEFVKVIKSERGVPQQRNLGGNTALGDILMFLDADVRFDKDFIENIVNKFEKRKLDCASPLYIPFKSNFLVNILFWYVNIIFILIQKVLPSGAGPCIVVRKDVFEKSEKFRLGRKFDDVEFVRKVGRKHKFGIILSKIYVSDRRFKKTGTLKMGLLYAVISILFTFGLFDLANKIEYKFGEYGKK